MMRVIDKEKIEKYRFSIGKLKDRIKRLQVFSDGAHEPFWKALREEIEEGVESSEKTSILLLLRPTVSSEEARPPAFVARALRGVVADVDHSQAKIESANNKIAEWNQEITNLQGKKKRPNERRSPLHV